MKRMTNKIYWLSFVDCDGEYYDLDNQTLDNIDDITQMYSNFKYLCDYYVKMGKIKISKPLVDAIIRYRYNSQTREIPVLYSKDYKILFHGNWIEKEALDYMIRFKAYREQISIRYINSDNAELFRCSNIVYYGLDNTVIRVGEHSTKPKVTMEDIKEASRILLGIYLNKKNGGNYRKYRDLYLDSKRFLEKRNKSINDMIAATLSKIEKEEEERDREYALKLETNMKKAIATSIIEYENELATTGSNQEKIDCTTNSSVKGTCLLHFIARLNGIVPNYEDKTSSPKPMIKQLTIF